MISKLFFAFGTVSQAHLAENIESLLIASNFVNKTYNSQCHTDLSKTLNKNIAQLLKL